MLLLYIYLIVTYNRKKEGSDIVPAYMIIINKSDLCWERGVVVLEVVEGFFVAEHFVMLSLEGCHAIHVHCGQPGTVAVVVVV